MSNFVVSARKYRPSRFEDVVGQEHVGQTLKNALKNDHLAHAFLFCGPRGVGKTTCARILAKVLNCQNSSETHEPCGICDNCESFEKNASFNIMELDAASNNSVEHIRTLVEQVRFQPQQGQYKIFIIDEVHMLSASAFNAFLKTLEEPPSYAIFILATTEKHKIIPTILSRCQIFDFKRIQVPQMVAHLEKICGEEGIEAEKDALHIISQKADGALRDSLSIFDRIVSFSGKRITYDDVITNLNILDYDYYFKFTDALLMQDVSSVMTIFDNILRHGFEGDIFLNGLGEHLRNLLVCKDAATLKLLEVSDNLKARYYEQAKLSPNSFILTALNLVNDCDINFKMARNKRLHVEMALIKMAFIGQAIELAKNPQPIAEKKKLVPSVETPTPVKTQVSTPTQNITPPPVSTPKTVETPPQNYQPSEPAIQQVEEPNAQISAPEPPKANPSKLSLKSKFDTVKLSSLDALEDEVEKEESEYVEEEKVPLTMENVKPLWDTYIANVKKGSIQSILKTAHVNVEKEAILIEVGSSLAKGTVQEERGLTDFIRKKLNRKHLEIRIEIDPSKALANQVKRKPKPLTDSEKYHHMKSTNPLVDKFRKEFDLRFDS